MGIRVTRIEFDRALEQTNRHLVVLPGESVEMEDALPRRIDSSQALSRLPGQALRLGRSDLCLHIPVEILLSLRRKPTNVPSTPP